MSTATETSVKGKFDEVAGKIKQGVGEAFNDQSLANSGTAQQVKGHAEQAWGSVKAAAQDTRNENEAHAESDGHDIREKIASTAQNVKEHVQAGIDSFKNKH
jgi:uncharacterized protein YjbJ (UPF0337 family)